jgi:hypothetical protein
MKSKSTALDAADALEAHLSRARALAQTLYGDGGASFRTLAENTQDLVCALLADELGRAQAACRLVLKFNEPPAPTGA